MNYIYVNSYPRSGSTFLVNVMNNLYGFWDNTSAGCCIPQANILKEHFQQSLLCTIPDTIQVTLVRDPIDAICSYLLKDIGDYIKVPKPDSDKLDIYLNKKIDLYNLYLNNAYNNKDNLIILDFEYLINHTEEVVLRIDSMFSYEPVRSISEAIQLGEMNIKKSNSYNQFHNNIPIKKNTLYYEYKDVLLGAYKDMFNTSYKIYNQIKSLL